MGSTQKYEGRYGDQFKKIRDMPTIHAKLSIKEEEFDAFKSHMHTILHDMEKSPDVITEVLDILET